MATRAYSNELRVEQSAVTRVRIVEAGRRLFVEHGYGETSLQTIAHEAGVSVQTVYNVIGSKATLFRLVYDVTLIGDDQPIPMAQRPEFRAVLDDKVAADALRRYAALGGRIARRVAPLLRSARSHPDLREFVATTENQRAIGTTAVADSLADVDLRSELTRDDVAALLWTLTGPENADRLVRQRGWSWERYETWLGQAMIDAVLARPADD